MARLSTLKPRITASPAQRLATSTVSSNPEAEQRTRGRKWMDIRAKWFRTHPLCVQCERMGRVAEATELDHIIPLIDGGKDDASNMQGLCHDCHERKTSGEARIRARGW